jgi:hypothetical protein
LTTEFQDPEQRKAFTFTNTSTIAGVRPILSPNYPAGEDFAISDQYRADGFIRELHGYENMPGDQLPQLMVMALGTDHTMGTRPGAPTPNAMVADNDLALGRIIEAVSKSRFWKETVIFVTEDDSQAGWDHVSAYRTTGFVISPYSRLQQTIHTNYNQTCMLRSIEQILGLPPMNVIDATASPMFSCFSNNAVTTPYTLQPNQVPINEMNKALSALQGKDRYYAEQSAKPEYDVPDRGDDDLLNRILWHYSKKNKSYPRRFAGKDED